MDSGYLLWRTFTICTWHRVVVVRPGYSRAHTNTHAHDNCIVGRRTFHIICQIKKLNFSPVTQGKNAHNISQEICSTFALCFVLLSFVSCWFNQIPLNRHHRCWAVARLQPYPRYQSPWGQHVAHLGPVGPRWAPCWSHEPCYQGLFPKRQWSKPECYEIYKSPECTGDSSWCEMIVMSMYTSNGIYLSCVKKRHVVPSNTISQIVMVDTSTRFYSGLLCNLFCRPRAPGRTITITRVRRDGALVPVLWWTCELNSIHGRIIWSMSEKSRQLFAVFPWS